jgi:hypothetical protein
MWPPPRDFQVIPAPAGSAPDLRCGAADLGKVQPVPPRPSGDYLFRILFFLVTFEKMGAIPGGSLARETALRRPTGELALAVDRPHVLISLRLMLPWGCIAATISFGRSECALALLDFNLVAPVGRRCTPGRRATRLTHTWSAPTEIGGAHLDRRSGGLRACRQIGRDQGRERRSVGRKAADRSRTTPIEQARRRQGEEE